MQKEIKINRWNCLFRVFLLISFFIFVRKQYGIEYDNTSSSRIRSDFKNTQQTSALRCLCVYGYIWFYAYVCSISVCVCDIVKNDLGSHILANMGVVVARLAIKCFDKSAINKTPLRRHRKPLLAAAHSTPLWTGGSFLDSYYFFFFCSTNFFCLLSFFLTHYVPYALSTP